MALTESEETKVRAIINAYDNGQQVDDLPLASSAMNKVIEVFDTAGGESQRMGLEDAVIGASQAYCGRVWNLDNATTVAASTIGSKDLLTRSDLVATSSRMTIQDRSSTPRIITGLRLERLASSMVPRDITSGDGDASGTLRSRP